MQAGRLRRTESACATSAQGARRSGHGARAHPAPSCGRRREAVAQGGGRYPDPASAPRVRGWMPCGGPSRMCGNAPKQSGGQIWRSQTRRVRKHPRGVEGRREPQTRKRATVADNAPDSRAASSQGRGSRSGRTRTQSCDCGGGGTRDETHPCARESEVGALSATREQAQRVMC